MDEPLVCCICLTRDRPEYLKQAVECFEAQTYQRKSLVVIDSSNNPIQREWTIGALRNYAIEWGGWKNGVQDKPDLIAHWDDDDWSAPERLAQQVAVIMAGAAITGYHDLPFYDVVSDKVIMYQSNMTGYAVGTSLLYRREVWERTPFPDKSEGEDASWQHAVRREQGHCVVATTSVVDGRPLMVARIHSGNTCKKFGNNYTAASAELGRAVRLVVDTNPKVAHTI